MGAGLYYVLGPGLYYVLGAGLYVCDTSPVVSSWTACLTQSEDERADLVE